MPEFDDLVEFAAGIERKALPHSEYSGKIAIYRAIDLSPPEYSSMAFSDLINSHDRVKKILATSRLAIYSSKAPLKKDVLRKTEEVELKVKEITTQTLEEAKEIEKQPEITFEKPVEVPEQKEEIVKVPELEIEFEKKPEKKLPETAEFEIPIETKPPEELELKKPEETKKELRPEAPVTPPPELKIQKSIPPILQKTPEQIGQASFGELEDKFRTEWESEHDEIKIKRKMLELTKDLFREKSMNMRERIKKQIVVLKNILGRQMEPKDAAKKQVKTEIAYSSTFLSTILNTQLSEVSASKDSIASSYNNKIDEMRGKLTETLGGIPEEDSERRQAAYGNFISELRSLNDQLPSIISRYNDFLTKKHSSELEQLRSSIPKSDSASLKECQSRQDELPSKYSSEFETIKGILSRQIDSIIDSIKPVAKTVAKADISEILSEINGTDDGSLLYYLHSKDPETYKKYERKHLSKSEAVNTAKRFLAKEKGLSAEQINKYFGK